MRLDCTNIHAYMGAFLLAQDCSLAADGCLRFATPFRYPNGDCIVLSVQADGPEHLVLSDAGGTLDYIAAHGALLEEAVKQAICQSFGIDCRQEALCLRLTAQQVAHGGLPDVVIDLAQACVRLAHCLCVAPLPATSAWS